MQGDEELTFMIYIVHDWRVGNTLGDYIFYSV